MKHKPNHINIQVSTDVRVLASIHLYLKTTHEIDAKTRSELISHCVNSILNIIPESEKFTSPQEAWEYLQEIFGPFQPSRKGIFKDLNSEEVSALGNKLFKKPEPAHLDKAIAVLEKMKKDADNQ